MLSWRNTLATFFNGTPYLTIYVAQVWRNIFGLDPLIIGIPAFLDAVLKDFFTLPIRLPKYSNK